MNIKLEKFKIIIPEIAGGAIIIRRQNSIIGYIIIVKSNARRKDTRTILPSISI